MKILGKTPQGGSIVEFSNQETGLLTGLQEAMSGASWMPGAPQGYPVEGNIEKAFLAVLHFVEVKFAINELKNLTDELNEAIGVKNEL